MWQADISTFTQLIEDILSCLQKNSSPSIHDCAVRLGYSPTPDSQLLWWGNKFNIRGIPCGLKDDLFLNLAFEQYDETYDLSEVPNSAQKWVGEVFSTLLHRIELYIGKPPFIAEDAYSYDSIKEVVCIWKLDSFQLRLSWSLSEYGDFWATVWLRPNQVS